MDPDVPVKTSVPVVILGEKSPGVKRIEVISHSLNKWTKVMLFVGIFLIAYAYGLDGSVRYVYQTEATSSYATHSLLATVNVLRAVIAAAAQPTLAKLMDVFGRFEVLLASVVFYIIGTIIEACSNNVESFSGGAILYQIGYTAVMLLAEVIVGDTTTLRNRVLFSFIPALPFLINAWISGNITAAVLGATTWRWGIGMWAIIYFVCALPLLGTLWFTARRAQNSGALQSYKTPFQQYGFGKLAIALFWQLDVVGIVLVIATFALILVPFTIAGSAKEQWKAGHIIAMLVVAFGESVESATRILNVYSFTSVIAGTAMGFAVRHFRYLKPFIIFGVSLFMVAFGLLIRYRGGGGSGSHSAIIGAQVVLGIGGGFFSYPTQASIQAQTKHEHLAIITSLYLASYSIGSALGATLSGAIWTNVLPGQLISNLGNATLAGEVYASPLTVALEYPMGTPERIAIVNAYKHTQKLLCITGICLCVPLLAFACLLRNPKLTDSQSLPQAEGETSSEYTHDDGDSVKDQKFPVE
ncbi:hypothetical protein PHLCEN_2v5134 [Hermanssonia centrifuga]|uniref:Uncharacterized protein n=1 Tax=Hermanssonia centrifuga TaxID=98765 RepID=A0A2R6PBX7_9APHY|nr:hypothetical protein PHLCEN_2v5134 [Hermanssonia centrifuga]